MVKQSKTVILGGTTASGKSTLAINLAKKFNGTIINADSVQLYQDLSILTARPDQNETNQARHQLYGLLEPYVNTDISLWLNLARKAHEDAINNGQLPIFVGGTGFYIRALFDGIADIPSIDQPLRSTVRAMDAASIDTLLNDRDPQSAARLPYLDLQRRMRALEVVLQTGVPLEQWKNRTCKGPLETRNALCIVLLPERTSLRARIYTRMEKMMENGALEQVCALLERYPDAVSLPIRKTHGLKEIIRHLQGGLSRQDVISQTSIQVGQYAKRQQTWFKHQIKGIKVLEHYGEDERTALQAHSLVKNFLSQ